MIVVLMLWLKFGYLKVIFPWWMWALVAIDSLVDMSRSEGVK